jgi:hypothetical protein
MKRRMLFLSLVLAVVMVMILPAAAFARGNDAKAKSGVTEFAGGGVLYVTPMPAPVIKGNIWRFNDEIAEGALLQSSWDLLAGAGFWSSHDSVVYVADDGACWGMMWGTFKLLRPDGVLEGFFEGKIRGNLYAGLISDSGSWHATGGSGVFAKVRAFGKWSADLAHNGVTLAGPLTWSGKYLAK